MSTKDAIKGRIEEAAKLIGLGGSFILCYETKDGICTCPGGSACQKPGKHPRHVWKERENRFHTLAELEAALMTYGPHSNIAWTPPEHIVVIDVDPRNRGDRSLEHLEDELGPLPHTAEAATGGGGRHLLFDFGGGTDDLPAKISSDSPGLDLKASNGYIVVSPSNHVSGNRYEWRHEPDKVAVADLPEGWRLKIKESAKRVAEPHGPGEIVKAGGRHDALKRETARLRNLNYSDSSMAAMLRAWVDTNCEQPTEVPDSEIREMVEYFAKKEGGKSVSAAGSPSAPPPVWLTPAELAAKTPADIEWIVEHLAAPGACTELDGKVKQSGKSTLLSFMVKAVRDGAAFCGSVTRKVPVVWVTEQFEPTFRPLLENAGLLAEEGVYCLTREQVLGLTFDQVVDAVQQKAREVSAGLIIMDTLSTIAKVVGDDEQKVGPMMEVMQKVARLTASGYAVIFARHDRKSGGAVGDSGRGSSAISGDVDIIVGLRAAPGANSNVRQVSILGRFGCHSFQIEYDKGTGYRKIAGGSKRSEAQEYALEVLSAGDKLTQMEIVKAIDARYRTKIVRNTMARALEALHDDGLIQSEFDPTKRSDLWHAVSVLV